MHAHAATIPAEPKSLSLDEVDGMLSGRSMPHLGTYIFASNSRTEADRAQKLFGFEAKAPGLFDCIEADVLGCLK